MEKEKGILLTLCTFPNEEAAREVGTLLVKKQVAACVNLIPKITSIYQWDNKICEDTEVLAMIKTTAKSYPQLEQEIKKLHPYEVPEVIALPIDAGSREYLNWVRESCQE